MFNWAMFYQNLNIKWYKEKIKAYFKPWMFHGQNKWIIQDKDNIKYSIYDY